MSIMDGIRAITVSDVMVGAVTLGADGTLEAAIKLMNGGELDRLVREGIGVSDPVPLVVIIDVASLADGGADVVVDALSHHHGARTQH